MTERFLLLYGLEFMLTFLLAIVWGLTGLAANGLKYAAFRHWRQAARIGCRTGIVLVLAWCAVLAAAWLALGWDFVMDRVLVMLPLLALPALLVVRSALPLLNRRDDAEQDMAPESAARVAAAIHTMTAGCCLTLWLLLFDIPSIPDVREMTAYLAALAGIAVLLRLYHRRRVRTIRLRRQGVRVFARRTAAWTVSAAALLAVWHLWSLERSKFPASMPMIHPETFEYGGGRAIPAALPGLHDHHHAQGASVPAAGNAVVSVADLTGPRDGEPDRRFTLVAQKSEIELPTGHKIEAWTFNGRVPGPELVVREGDLVEVVLINRDIEAGVTVHWHGVDVPNAEDGVPGVTQNAVMPGESHTYRFVVNETGSRWYHSHQTASVQVVKGLFGAFIILPKEDRTGASGSAGGDVRDESDGSGGDGSAGTGMSGGNVPGGGDEADITVFSHDWETPDGIRTALHLAGPGGRRIIPPGTNVRLRLMNSSSLTKIFALHGIPFRVSAIDGWDIHEPDEVEDTGLKIGGGGRYDVTFTMPDHPVTLVLHGEDIPADTAVVFSPDGRGSADIRPVDAILDPLNYGSPAPAPFDDDTAFDREFLMVLDQIYFGHYNGRRNALWAINGEVFPHTPTFAVEEGDLVKTRIVNRSLVYHPMHLHGHHVFVLSRNGKPYTGSPLWLDTVLVEPGETWEVAFRADNPGIWMDHCHVLEHAARGMAMHLAYANVTTPYMAGEATGNHPE